MKKWQNRDNIFLHPSNNPHKRPPRLSRVPDMVCVCVCMVAATFMVKDGEEGIQIWYVFG
ncbi:hypothetical protein HanXRQr2_Chr04g0181201 [Helianthus annuus]|uniref:Uncharacterized protein n=1 Tax=Helianthus annuus TaxID=4232 RepID=A0A9K3J9W1_HELAN|nr:hypothetical protein HanXRQr2_Chr04g0181201 [Helianthus annuus]